MADPNAASEALRGLQVEHAAALAQNAELRALLAAEMEYSAKLTCYQQKYHESHGRTNPEKGNLNSVFYRDLKDENGNSLIPPEMVGLDATVRQPPDEIIGEWVGDKNDGEGAEVEAEAEAEADEIRWRIQYSRSFQSQRA